MKKNVTLEQMSIQCNEDVEKKTIGNVISNKNLQLRRLPVEVYLEC